MHHGHRFDILSSLAPLEPEWDALHRRVGTHLASRPAYVIGAEHLTDQRVGSSRGVLCGVVRRDDRLVAIAPLSTRSLGAFVRGELLGDHLGMVTEILAEDDDAADALWHGLADRGIALRLTSVDRTNRALLRLLGSTRWATTTSEEKDAFVADVPENGSVGLRGSRSRRRLRKLRRDFTDAGHDLTFEDLRTPADLDRRWEDMQRVSALAAAAKNPGSDHYDFLAPPLGDLVRTVLHDEAEHERMTITGLVIDGRWSAHLVTVSTGTVAEGWVTHYDPSISDLQPGHALVQHFVDDARDDDVDTVDLGGGHTGFKTAWATRRYPAVTVHAEPVGRPSVRVAGALARRVESSTTVRSTLRTASRLARHAVKSVR